MNATPNIITIKLGREGGRITPGSSPWIRRAQVAKILGPADPAGLARLVGPRDEPLGWGLYSPDSGIVVRLLSWSDAPLAPDWLEQRIHAAFATRTRLGLGQSTTGYRVVNSEGDGLPGLVIDRYGDHLVVHITTAPMAVRESAIVATARALVPGVVFISRPEHAAAREGFAPENRIVGPGEPPAELEFRESGVRFVVPAPPSQKTGAYFDQRDNRRRMAELAQTVGGPLLDLGCYVGGFALAAAKMGVTTVGVDTSDKALGYAARNAELNEVSSRCTWIPGDIFSPLDDPRLAGPFGAIVFDPPKVAASKSHVRSAKATLTRALATILPRVAPGGVLATCSCSHHVDPPLLDRCVVEASLHSKTPDQWTRVGLFGPGVDHPVALGHAEGNYLHMAVYRRQPLRR